jgi:hypothetical protein
LVPLYTHPPTHSPIMSSFSLPCTLQTFPSPLPTYSRFIRSQDMVYAE